MRARHRHRGITLLELLVTLAVASILLTVAVPNMQVLVQNNRTV
ncbi:prepilin-type N-terminal cleavage/methylation domain-containing protein, partial [Aquisalimonas sp.]